jgi:hypothetical protein
MVKPYTTPHPARRRIKPSQKQMGNISKNVRTIVSERSNGVCERCNRQRATQMAHLIGRKQLTHMTTEKDLLHVCIYCHKWMDETVEGIRWKRGINGET